MKAKVLTRLTALLLTVAVSLCGCSKQQQFPQDGEPDYVGGMYFGMDYASFSIDAPLHIRLPINEPVEFTVGIMIYENATLGTLLFQAGSEEFSFNLDSEGAKNSDGNCSCRIKDFYKKPELITHHITKINGEKVDDYLRRNYTLTLKYNGQPNVSGYIGFDLGGDVYFVNENGETERDGGDIGTQIYFAANEKYIVFSTLSRGSAESCLLFGKETEK